MNNHRVGSHPDTLRTVAFITLSPLGAAPIVGLFYSLYAHLPAYLPLLWRAMLGTSFAVGALALTAAWLLLLAFDLLPARNRFQPLLQAS